MRWFRRARVQERPRQRYILDSLHHPRPIDDEATWARWMARNATICLIGSDFITYTTGVGVFITTAFMGYQDEPETDPPSLWQTVVTSNQAADQIWRYTTADDARSGHDAVINRLRSA